MRILITGANGFLGSHIVDRLAAAGHDLRLMLRPTSSLSYLDGASYERVDGDLRDEESLRRAVDGVEAVIHCGGLTSARSEAAFKAVNAQGTAAIAGAAAAAGVQRFVYVSSLAAFGPSDNLTPSAEREPHPVSAYGRSKLAGEHATLALAHEMSVAVVRPPVVYGPRDRGLLPIFRLVKLRLMPLYGDGLNYISWIHVHDAADAIALAATSAGPTGSVYNISDGASHTWRELATALSRHMERRMLMLGVPHGLYAFAGNAAGLGSRLSRRSLPLSPDKVEEMRQRFWVCDNARITAELGWEPRVYADEGIAMTLRWYREHRWL